MLSQVLAKHAEELDVSRKAHSELQKLVNQLRTLEVKATDSFCSHISSPIKSLYNQTVTSKMLYGARVRFCKLQVM